MEFSTLILAFLALPTVAFLIFLLAIKVWPKADDNRLLQDLRKEINNDPHETIYH
jgi:hypothetical protein